MTKIWFLARVLISNTISSWLWLSASVTQDCELNAVSVKGSSCWHVFSSGVSIQKRNPYTLVSDHFYVNITGHLHASEKLEKQLKQSLQHFLDMSHHVPHIAVATTLYKMIRHAWWTWRLNLLEAQSAWERKNIHLCKITFQHLNRLWQSRSGIWASSEPSSSKFNSDDSSDPIVQP